MILKITPQPGIMDIKPYIAGTGHIDGVKNAVKLSSNENPLGPSPMAKEAYRREASHLNIYPKSDHSELFKVLADTYSLNPKHIICGNGSDEILSLITQAFAGVGDEVVFTEYGFSMYKIYSLAVGATPIIVPEKKYTTDVDAILSACNDKTKIVFIANPNNPTGTMIDLNEIERLADNLPKQVLLVLDGAYVEFVEDYDGGAALIAERNNIIMTRTFSKIYGLSGLRLGWAYGPKDIIDILARLRSPFNVNSAALAAGKASLRDKNYVIKCRDENLLWRMRFENGLKSLGFLSTPSFANFILVHFKDKKEAMDVDKYLQNNGFIVRAMQSYGLDNCLRITIGKGADCKRMLEVFKSFKDKQVNA